jgi:hypothetical protein
MLLPPLFFLILLLFPSSTSASLPLLPLPLLLPIRYDVQLQLPTASDQDPLVPTFFGSAKIDFQLTRSLPSPSEPPELDGSVRLTFLAQQLDQFMNVSLALSGKEEEEPFQVGREAERCNSRVYAGPSGGAASSRSGLCCGPFRRATSSWPIHTQHWAIPGNFALGIANPSCRA